MNKKQSLNGVVFYFSQLSAIADNWLKGLLLPFIYRRDKFKKD